MECERRRAQGRPTQEELLARIDSSDWYHRWIVAISISVRHLHRMMHDENVDVRLMVAQRIDRENALLMSGTDSSAKVRAVALKRALGAPRWTKKLEREKWIKSAD